MLDEHKSHLAASVREKIQEMGGELNIIPGVCELASTAD
jgi:hypothetical protein